MATIILRVLFLLVASGNAVLIFNSEALRESPSWVPWGVLGGMIAGALAIIGIAAAIAVPFDGLCGLDDIGNGAFSRQFALDGDALVVQKHRSARQAADQVPRHHLRPGSARHDRGDSSRREDGD